MVNKVELLENYDNAANLHCMTQIKHENPYLYYQIEFKEFGNDYADDIYEMCYLDWLDDEVKCYCEYCDTN